MNEPQELRSIDELFRNTFNNLPDTPAESGWDTPSERVWQQVQSNIQTPRNGWSLSSKLLLVGFAAVLAVGLYLTFSIQPQTSPQQAAPAVTAPVQAPPLTPLEPVQETQATTADVAPKFQPIQIPKRNHRILENWKATPEPSREEMPAVTNEPAQPRTSGAAPLPGSSLKDLPNTTEQRKAEHARQLELRWKTPLPVLPVPRDKTIQE